MNNYRCPICNNILLYHHTNSDSESYECPKCKHLIMARFLKDELKILNKEGVMD